MCGYLRDLQSQGKTQGLVEVAIDNRPPSNIGRACVTTKEAKRKIITASESRVDVG